MSALKRKSDRAAEPTPKKPRPDSDGSAALKAKSKARDPVFPRGGGSVLSPLELKQIQSEARQDALFEESAGRGDDLFEAAKPRPQIEKARKAGRGAPARKASKQDHRADRNASVRAAERTERTPKIDGGLAFKALVPDAIVLGQVNAILDSELLLTLPNGLVGHVSLERNQDILAKEVVSPEEETSLEDADEKTSDPAPPTTHPSSCFHVGQYLRARVVSNQSDSIASSIPRKQIRLSVAPSDANAGLSLADCAPHATLQARVTSVEDHGLVMDAGFEERGVKLFLPTSELNEVGDATSKINLGAMMLCRITSVHQDRRLVTLSSRLSSPDQDSHAWLLGSAPTVKALLPGTAVEVDLAAVSSRGIAGTVLKHIPATTDVIHSGASAAGKELPELFADTSKVTARLLYSLPTSQGSRVGFSLLPHLLSLSSGSSHGLKATPEHDSSLPVGTIVSDATVCLVDPKLGVYLRLSTAGDVGFAHVSRLEDGVAAAPSASSGSFKVKSQHQARILDYNAIDNVWAVTLEQRAMRLPFVGYEDIQIGQKLTGTFERLVYNQSGELIGALVRLTDNVTGFVPTLHLSDVHLEHPERKFRAGNPVTARAFDVNREAKKVTLTLKKTLVNSEPTIWDSTQHVEVGASAIGILTKVLFEGAMVQFYGRCRGFLPVSQMSEQFLKDPREHFKLGQALKVYVMAVDVERSKLTLSCREPSSADPQADAAWDQIAPGKLVSGEVTEKLPEGMIIELHNNGPKAHLQLGHIADGSIRKCEAAAKRIRVGQEMRNLLVWQKQAARRKIHLSNQAQLIQSFEEGIIPQALAALNIEDTVAGCVKNITDFGVFVEFFDGLVGLIPKDQLPSESLNLQQYGLRLHQHLRATVRSIDIDRGRLTLSMRSQQQKDRNAAAAPKDPQHNAEHGPKLGQILDAKIISVKETQLNVELPGFGHGRVDVSAVFDSIDTIKDRKRPLQSFKKGENLQVRVLGLHDSRNHRFLPISNRGKTPVFELTAKPSDLKRRDLRFLTLDQISKGSTWLCFVNNLSDNAAWVNIAPNIRGRIRFLELSEDPTQLASPEKHFPPGTCLSAQVTAIDLEHQRLDLSVRQGSIATPNTVSDLSVSSVLVGRITKVTDKGPIVQLSDTLSAPVHLTAIDDDYDQVDMTRFEKDDFVRVCVTARDLQAGKVELSLRPSRTLNSESKVIDPEIKSFSDLKLHDVLRGFVKHIGPTGIFVALSPDITAYVRVSDLSDDFVKDWKSVWQQNQLVRGKIVFINTDASQVQMSLKDSTVHGTYHPQLTYADFHVGEEVTGRIRKVEDFGIFVVLDNSRNVSGLCHRSEMADEKVQDARHLYREGQQVTVKIRKIDVDNRRMSLSTRSSTLLQPSSLADDDNSISSDPGSPVADDEATQAPSSKISLPAKRKRIEQPITVETDDLTSDIEMGGLDAGDFDWSKAPFDELSTLNRQEDKEQSDLPKRKRTRKDPDKDMTGELDVNGPQMTSDFERLLLGQPNDSVLWLSYMAFYLRTNDVDQARAVAERAVRVVNRQSQESEDEALNVWTALLNLENTYGDVESFEAVLGRACEANDPRDMYSRSASILIQSGNSQRAETILQIMVKKFSADPKIWLNYGTFLFETVQSAPQARDLLNRALQALPKQHHVDIISKFAALEFRSKQGERERGRTLFEGLLSTYPKRLDLVNVLLDLEIRVEAYDNVRALFDRVLSGAIRPKKAKFFFKRWLHFEESHGRPKDADKVKARAAAYVRDHSHAVNDD